MQLIPADLTLLIGLMLMLKYMEDRLGTADEVAGELKMHYIIHKVMEYQKVTARWVLALGGKKLFCETLKLNERLFL